MDDSQRKQQIITTVQSATSIHALAHLFESIADLAEMKAYFLKQADQLVHFPISSVNYLSVIPPSIVQSFLAYLSFTDLTNVATVCKEFNEFSHELRKTQINNIIPHRNQYDMVQIIDYNRYSCGRGLNQFERSQLNFNGYEYEITDYEAKRKKAKSLLSLVFNIAEGLDRSSDYIDLMHVDHTIIGYTKIKLEDTQFRAELNRLMMVNIHIKYKNQIQTLFGSESLSLTNCLFSGTGIRLFCDKTCIVEKCRFLGPVVILGGGHYQFRNCEFSREFDADAHRGETYIPSPIYIIDNPVEIKIENCYFYHTNPFPPISLMNDATADFFTLSNNKRREQFIKRDSDGRGKSYKYSISNTLPLPAAYS